VQLRRGGKAVNPWLVDIHHGNVRTFRYRGGHDALADRHLSDNLYVVLQVQHRNQRVPQNPHVLCDQNPDHRPLRPAVVDHEAAAHGHRVLEAAILGGSRARVRPGPAAGS